MSTVKQIAERVLAIQFQHMPQGIKRAAFEILEKNGDCMVSDSKDPVGVIYAALYAAQIIKSRE